MIFNAPKDIKTIHDIVHYLKQLPVNIENMPIKDRSEVASGIMYLFKQEKFREQYPELDELVEVAADLQWQNYYDDNPKPLWDDIRKLTAELEQRSKS